jgi:uncharacterized membrane protein YkvA (DUF1232 family)
METPTDFERVRQAAEELSKENQKIAQLIDSATMKAKKEKQRILDFWGKLQTMIRMVKAYLSGEYTNIPWKTIVFVIAGIIYFLNPMDVVPDVIPTLGYLDDATVIAFIVNAAKEDIEKFRLSQTGTD